MAVSAPCPDNWDYETVPGYQHILAPRTKAAAVALAAADHRSLVRQAKNTRPTHASYFQGLTPPGFGYFAGHYRGEPLRCLRRYQVKIIGEPLVGFLAHIVVQSMRDFANDVDLAVNVCDLVNSRTALTDAEKFLRTIKMVASLFVFMLPNTSLRKRQRAHGAVYAYVRVGEVWDFSISVDVGPATTRAIFAGDSCLSAWQQGFAGALSDAVRLGGSAT